MSKKYRVIPSFPDYEVSHVGNVRRATPRKTRKNLPDELTPSLSGTGYLVVSLMDQAGNRVVAYVHRLVCEAFSGDAPQGHCHAAHRDGNKTNNAADNLYWATPRQNAEDARQHGTMMRGTKHPLAVLTDAGVRGARKDRSAGLSWSALASKYGVGRSVIRRAVNGETWRHV